MQRATILNQREKGGNKISNNNNNYVIDYTVTIPCHTCTVYMIVLYRLLLL